MSGGASPDGLWLFATHVEDESGTSWIEFYWAEDVIHAREQAKDANPGATIDSVSGVPELVGGRLPSAAGPADGEPPAVRRARETAGDGPGAGKE